jgi:hypothetical protein
MIVAIGSRGKSMPIDPENLRPDHIHCRAICEEIGDRLRDTILRR